MDKYDERISEEIKRVAGRLGKNSFPLMSGKVVAGSIDESKYTCKVKLTVNGADNATDGIMLNTVTMNSNGMVLYPADGSNVIVGEVNGPGRWTLLKCSDLVKMQVIIGNVSFTLTASEAEMKQGAAAVLLKDGKIQLNDGSHGGLMKVEETADKIKALEQDLNSLKQAFQIMIGLAPTTLTTSPGNPDAFMAVFATQMAAYITEVFTPTTKTELENDKVKH